MPTPAKQFTLNNGQKVDSVLFGSYNNKGEDGVEAIVYALDEAGYHGIDTASYYGNHDAVKGALQKTKVPRDQIFLQTKLWPNQMREPEKFLDQFIEELGTYVDCYMIHWPLPIKPEGDRVLDTDWDFVKTWKLMEKIPKSKARSIGVSNFTVKQLERLLKETTVVPVINQCEFHPELPQQELVDFCHAHKILPQGFRPLGKGQILEGSIQEIAKKHNCDPGQVCISWNVIRGVCVIPKSSHPKRIISNHELVDLTDEDIAEINKLGVRHNRTASAVKIVGVDYFDE